MLEIGDNKAGRKEIGNLHGESRTLARNYRVNLVNGPEAD
jgi:hypothetical protein